MVGRAHKIPRRSVKKHLYPKRLRSTVARVSKEFGRMNGIPVNHGQFNCRHC